MGWVCSLVAALAPSFGPAATVGRRRRSASLVRSPPRLALSRRRPSSLSAAAAAAAHVDPGGYNNEDIHEDAGASEEDFSWRLLEGSNVHVARHHRRGDDANGRRVRRESPRRESVLDLDAVERFSARRGMKKQHVARVYRELFRRGRASFTGAPDVGTEDMKALDEAFAVTTSEVVEHKVTSDGTGAKMVVRLHDGALVETVIIGHERASTGARRNTVCVSTQVGCRMGCTFCETGTMGLLANLTAGEIVEQVWHARRLVGAEGVRNVVFMGMGEPLDNYEEVLVALRALTHQSMFDMRQSAVTVSTVGLPARIKQLADDAPGVNLALSLHAPTQDLRARLLPSAAGTEHTLTRLLAALRYHREASGRGAMIEYIVIHGINDAEEDARALGQVVAEELSGDGFPGSKTGCGSLHKGARGYYVNLIPYNPTAVGETHGYETPKDAALERMREILTCEFGVKAKVRWSTAKGREVDGACGQLALKSMTSPSP